MVDEIDSAYSSVLLLCNEGNFARARVVCDDFETKFPEEVRRINHLRAIVERRDGNISKATSLLESSLDNTLQGIANRHSLLRILVRQRDFVNAFTHANEVIVASRKVNNGSFVTSAASIATYCLIELRRVGEAKEYLMTYCADASDDERVPTDPPTTVGALRNRLTGR